ncbi:telomere binding protein [Mortierella antarctica]|nr:telomere binding protein [Mortierella antarctica]
MSDAQDLESISAYITDLQSQVRASSHGLAAVIRVLAEPLSFLGMQTATPHSDPLPRWTGPKEPTTARRLYFIRHLLPNHLEFILDTITVDWLCALPTAQQLALFDAYFISVSTQLQPSPLNKAVAVISLQTLTNKINRQFHDNHSFLNETLLRLLRKQLDTISLYDYHEGCALLYGRIDLGAHPTSQSQTDAVWDSLLSKLFSIPTRISNVYGASKTQIERCFQEPPFFQRQVNQLQECLQRTATLEGDLRTQHTRAWAVVINKFLRLGHGKTLAESLVSECWNTHSSLELGLRRVLTASPSSPGTAQLFLTTMMEYLDREQLAIDRHHHLSSVENQRAAVHRAARLLVSIGFGIGEKNNSMVEGVLSQGKVFGIGTLRTLICVQTDSRIGQTFMKALSIWSDTTFVNHASVDYQKFVCYQLLLMIGYFKAAHLLEMPVISAFNAGMSNWLDLDSFQRKRTSLVVAEEVSRAVDTIGASADFDLDNTDPEIQFARSLVELRDGCIPLSLSVISEQEAAKAAGGMDDEISTGSAAPSTKDDQKQLLPDSDDEEDPDAIVDPYTQISAADSDVESSEDEDDEDLRPYDMDYESDPDEDPEAVKRPKVVMPLYLRDLLTNLRAHEDRDKMVMGLQKAEELIRRKAGSLELEEYAEDLADVFTLLQDNFDTPNFFKLREGALVALVVTAPLPVVRVLTEQFYAKKNSQGQRLNILTAIGRGAQELSGYEPPSSAKQSPPPQGASGSMNRGAEPAPANAASARAVLKPSFETISTSIAMEKTRRFSQKSHIEARRSAPKANAFANLASVFLGGLLGRWGGNRGPGVERGYDALLRAPALLLKKFVLTIACLVHFAGNSPHLLPITRELFQFLLALRYHSPPAQPSPGRFSTGVSSGQPQDLLSSMMAASSVSEQPLTSLKLPGDIGVSATASLPNDRSLSQQSMALPYNADLAENLLFGLLILVTPSPSALSDELLVTEFYPEIMECQQWAMELWEEQKLKEGEDKSKMYCAALLQRCFELLKI